MNEEFINYRKKYKVFYYNSYSIIEDENAFTLKYEFEIPELTKFEPQIRIIKKDIKNTNSFILNNLAFHIGLIELISYWKSVCSPKVIIKCGYLNEKQIKWWKKLYFYGLGELFYTNNIKTNIQDFMEIQYTQKQTKFEYENTEIIEDGYIVPIGGGKDSIVTLETLDIDKKRDYCLIINPKKVTKECAKIAGLEQNTIEVYRKIDENLISLNKQGYINGHTPFSAMLAFVSYMVAYLIGKKYVALSNENSANESNVLGEDINHQYSKSYEFECDFRDYANKYLKLSVEYFSFLRPLNELQIAKIFSRQEKYHQVFRSCNVGSKKKEWEWCCNCAKCLFAYIILSPFLYKEKLISIFGEDLYENEGLLNTFIELTGNGKVKPFECVGTFEEVNYALSKTIKDFKDELPFLLRYYKDNYKLSDLTIDLTKEFNSKNNLTRRARKYITKRGF